MFEKELTHSSPPGKSEKAETLRRRVTSHWKNLIQKILKVSLNARTGTKGGLMSGQAEPVKAEWPLPSILKGYPAVEAGERECHTQIPGEGGTYPPEHPYTGAPRQPDLSPCTVSEVQPTDGHEHSQN
ncbi:hypothetical protein P7K49_010021 [Saguinus oedipus]|uniref:Uncharacterized protein n=1 Tax=Saguinus oedipus TaxID=9490 RepID=A0ABQ9VM65_SAGOE|nr:hypothetical protein P7K49_010021 [Saguinus oedipus]